MADDLAAQLPPSGNTSPRTIQLQGAGSGERFGLDEFTRRAAARGRMREPDATYQARVVMEVVGEATLRFGQGPSVPLGDLRSLTDAGTQGPLKG